MKLAYNAHDIEAVATKFKSGDWGVEVTIEWIEDSQKILENEKKFSPHEMFSSQHDAESWGMLAALRWIDAGKPNTEALITRFTETCLLHAFVRPSAFTVKRRLKSPASTRIAEQNADGFFGFDSRILQQFP